MALRPMARLDHVIGYCGRGAATPNLFYTQAGQLRASLSLSADIHLKALDSSDDRVCL